MKMDFIKMQAQGNDYIYFDFLETDIPELDYSVLSLKLSDRHFGIGSDGIVLILPDEKNDAFMRIFNADGSEAEMCGSALRCTASYLNSRKKLKKSSINTLSGKKKVEIKSNGKIRVSLGKAKMPKKRPISIFGFSGYPVNIGNPNEFTMLELAQEVLLITNSKSKLIYLPLPADDPTQRKPDISLAKKELDNWEPKIQLADGLKKTIDYFDNLLKEGV